MDGSPRKIENRTSVQNRHTWIKQTSNKCVKLLPIWYSWIYIACQAFKLLVQDATCLRGNGSSGNQFFLAAKLVPLVQMSFQLSNFVKFVYSTDSTVAVLSSVFPVDTSRLSLSLPFHSLVLSISFPRRWRHLVLRVSIVNLQLLPGMGPMACAARCEGHRVSKPWNSNWKITASKGYCTLWNFENEKKSWLAKRVAWVPVLWPIKRVQRQCIEINFLFNLFTFVHLAATLVYKRLMTHPTECLLLRKKMTELSPWIFPHTKRKKIFSTYSHLFESEGIGIGIGRIEVFGLIFEKYAVKWAASYIKRHQTKLPVDPLARLWCSASEIRIWFNRSKIHIGIIRIFTYGFFMTITSAMGY